MVLQDNVWFAKVLYQNQILFIPALAYWASTFVGSLHAPVLQFYYSEVGANPDQIGNIGVLSSVFALLLAPLYGKLVDAKYTYLAMLLSWLLCTFGCLLRGIAHSIDYLYLGGILMGLAGSVDALVLAHLSLHIDRTRRATVVSCFGAISTFVSLSGSLLYPPVNRILVAIIGVDDNDVHSFAVNTHIPPGNNEKKLLRYRVTVALCTLGCFVGFLFLIRMIVHIYFSKNHTYSEVVTLDLETSDSEGSTLDNQNIATDKVLSSASVHDESSESASESVVATSDVQDDEKNDMLYRRILIVCMAAGLVILSITRVVINVVWPLYLKYNYGWGTMEYGTAVIFSAISNLVHLSLLPSFERRSSLSFVLVTSLLVCSVLSFITIMSANASPYLHAILMCWLSGLLAMTESCLKSMCTLYGGRIFQGRTWGLLSSLSEIGRMTGSSFTRFLKYNYNIPFLVTSFLLFGSFVVFGFLKKADWMNDPHQIQHAQVYQQVAANGDDNNEISDSKFVLQMPVINASTPGTISSRKKVALKMEQ